jgi:RNA polymerase sigma-70 factor, ECF subfamily
MNATCQHISATGPHAPARILHYSIGQGDRFSATVGRGKNIFGVPMTESGSADDEALRASRLLIAIGEAQDGLAFRALFDAFAPRLRSFIGGRGAGPDMVEEVVQETFVNIWKKARLYDPSKAAASTWIFTIARNVRIDMLRKINRPAPDLHDPALVAEPEPRADQVIERDQDATRLNQAIAGLSGDQQEVLRMAFMEEKTHAEIADELGIPLGTIKSRIRLAFGRIRSELGDDR